MVQHTLQKNDTLQNGKYQILSILGQGGFGITYLARHAVLQVEVAIKELFLSAQNTYCTRSETDKTVIPHFEPEKFADFRQRFLDEAYTLARFKNVKGIVQAVDTFEENGTVYFVMEYIAGKSLKNIIETKGALTEKQATEYIIKLLDALTVVHDKGVLHRDINPNNILIDEQNNPVLIDFGIAREYEEDVTQTQTTFRTVGYSAPEQAVLKAKRGAYTDIYSIGGTLYFMLTAQRPQSTDEIDLDGFQSPKDIKPNISDTLNSVVIKAIKKRPNDRFQSCQEFKQAILGNAETLHATSKTEDDKTLIDTPQQKKQQKQQDDDKTLIDKTQQQKQEKKIETVQPKTKVADDFDREIENAQKRNRFIYIGIGIVAFIAILYFAFKNTGPSPQELAEQRRQDSIRKVDSLVKVAGQLKQDSIAYANNKEIQEKEEKAWKEAKRKDNKETYEKFIADFSQSKYKAEAEKAKENIGKFNYETIYVSGGTFQMGGNENHMEEPIHSVTVSGFSIGKYEVTQAQWKHVMGSKPSYFKNCGNCPVENVSWNDIQTFLHKLKQQTGKTYRLPSEAEWEFAARGGNNNRGYTYSGGNDVGSVAQYHGNNNKGTKQVGSKSPNELGIYDMSGNVREWCQDWYKGYPGSSSGFDFTGESRVHRGGSWRYIAKSCRVSARDGGSLTFHDDALGFRIVLVP